MINVLFTQMKSYENTPYCEMMLRSLLKNAPGNIRIIQLSDKGVQKVEGVDELIEGDFVFNKNTFCFDFFRWVYKIHTDFGDTLMYCDCDMLFANYFGGLFVQEYDIAIAKRYDLDGTSHALRRKSPYNTGLIISNTPDFWQNCHLLTKAKDIKMDWRMPQQLMCQEIKTGKYDVLFLSGDVYNRPPNSPDDYNKNVILWHFKGQRKKFMADWERKWIKEKGQHEGKPSL